MISINDLLSIVYLVGLVGFNLYILNGFFIKPNRLTESTDASLALIIAMLFWPITLVLMGVGTINRKYHG